MKFEIGEIAIMIITNPSQVNKKLRPYLQNGMECKIEGPLHSSPVSDLLGHDVEVPGCPIEVFAAVDVLRKRRPPSTYKDQHTSCEKGWEELQKELETTTA